MSWLARIEATAGLQMSQPRPVPWPATTSSKRVYPWTATTSKSSARVSAKCSHRLRSTVRPCGGEPVLDDRLHQRLAGAAGAAGPEHRVTQAGLSQGVPVPVRVLGEVTGDRRLVTLLQEQTSASSGSPISAPPRPAGQDQLLGVLRQRDAAGDHRPQHAVRRRVADQDPAEQPGAVLGDDQLLVDPGDRVGEDQLEGALGGREGVAEAGHVDAHQLQLGGHVGAEERARPAEQRVDDDLGHRVAGGDQAVHPPGGGRALADRPHVRVGAAALLVDQDAAALGDGRARRPGPARRGAGCRRRRPPPAPGSGRRRAARGRVTRPASSPSTSVVAAPVCTDRPSPSTWRRRVAPPASSTCTAISRGAISTTWVSRPELGQRVGGLEAEQAAADHGTHPGAGGRVPDRLQVLDGAVDEAAVQVPAGDRRHERRGAGGQHQLVVRRAPRRR